MITLPDHIMKPLKRVNRVYFTDPDRILAVPAGGVLVRQDEECHRVFLVLRGTFVAYRRSEHIEGSELPGETQVRGQEVFRAEPRSYVCVQSFFSRSYHSSYFIVALEDAEVAYIDEDTEAVEPEKYGTLEQQFIPVLVHELAARNYRIFTHVSEKEEAVRLLQRAEMASTLAQLSAGIAHELNNAVGVIERRADFVAQNIAEFLRTGEASAADLFRLGLDEGAFVTAAELRGRAREFEHRFDLSQDAAKVLAHVARNADEVKQRGGTKFVTAVQRNYRFWELGHDLRDLQTAARHAAGIVRAVKMLGGGTNSRTDGVDVNQSVRDALSLLYNRVKSIDVETEFGELPGIHADVTELVQLWTNIIKNACDAMEHAETTKPKLHVTTKRLHADGLKLLPTDYVAVSISNNGPPIPEELRDKIFRPSFTTKKLGLDFGLGLGLAIVRRIVDSYGGTIELHSSIPSTTFTINLPTTQIHG